MGKKEGDNFKGNQVKFGSGQPTNLGGRKPNTLNAFVAKLKEEGYERASAKEVIDAYEYLLTLPMEKLNELANDPKQMVIIKHLAFLLHSKDNKRAFDIMEKMLDRAHGKAAQNTILSTQSEQPIIQLIETPRQINKSDE